MRLRRPHIPTDVRLLVIARQLASAHKLMDVLWAVSVFPKKAARLEYLIEKMFGTTNVHLDHEPPLCLRYFDDATGKYTPDANDPEHLIYRTEEDHRIKTFVRGDGAQHSDAAKRRMAIKAERKRQEPSRPSQWPKARKIQSRPFPKRLP